jgi:hypothetical protein
MPAKDEDTFIHGIPINSEEELNSLSCKFIQDKFCKDCDQARFIECDCCNHKNLICLKEFQFIKTN